ncbi:MAG: AzlD domain-containing protein [Deltaproteobacteria bacterium]|nr:AzlD domain-containing protein [Deltaproteobacteria bacterium]
MDQKDIFLTMIGMGLVTYLPRLLPILLLASRSLPRLVENWLNYVPVAVMAALVGPALLVPDSKLDISFTNLFLLAALPTFAVAIKFRSLSGSVLVGVGFVAGARYFLGM